MSAYTIHLSGGTEDKAATLVTDEEEGGELCHVALHYRDRTLQASASDYFEAFCSIRAQLEPEGLIPFCYGASLKVFPSPMSHDMGGGVSAYRLAVGRHARQADLVDIFDAGPDVIPASVANQQQFYETWLRSPRA